MNSSAHTPKRRGRRRHHVALRRTLSVLAAGSLVAGLTGGSQTAYAAPDRTLQSVDVSLGSDGTITGIASTVLGEGEEGGSEQSFEPSEAAADLPVRVLTSWRLDDRAGTDLADIEGESGRVTIDVTVQNTTVRPERVEYDSNGTRRSQFALVGAPLTVVASADVGSLAQVVTFDDEDEVTNGVLSRSESGSSQVQWAAMLAPPRLATTATFRLVQQTDSFEVPTFDVSVQPGLVTDPSVDQLLRSAFSEDPSSALRVEQQTIGLITEVNGVLTEATRALDDVRAGLSGTADNLGRRTIADLQASTRSVSASLLSVASSIESLEQQTNSQLDSTSSELTGQLEQTLGDVRSLLGDPSADDVPPLSQTRTDKCGAALPERRGDQPVTIYQQVLVVEAQLEALDKASDACADRVRADLVAAIGQPSQCGPGDRQAVCVLDQARSDLRDQAESFAAFTGDIQDLYGAPLTELETSVGRLNTSMAGVVNTADAILAAGPDNEFRQLEQLVEQLDGRLVDVLGSLQGVDLGDFQDVLDALTGVRGIAEDQVTAADEVLAANPVEGVTDDVFALLGELCQVPDPLAGLPPIVIEFLELAVTKCDDLDSIREELSAKIGALRGQLQSSRNAWQGIVDDADLGPGAGVEGIADQLSAIGIAVQDLRDSDLLAELRAGVSLQDGGLAARVRDLRARLATVYGASGGGTPNASCSLPYTGNGTEPTLDGVNRRVAILRCRADNIDTDLTKTYEDIDDSVTGTDTELEQGIADTVDARRVAAQDVDRVIDELGRSVDTVGNEIRTEARGAVGESREALRTGTQSVVSTLEEGSRSLQDTVSQSVGSASRDLVSAEEQLLGDLRAVLLDLGDPSVGSGILGSLSTNADQTAASTRQVLLANNAASDFAGVRSSALDDIYLQREQLLLSLQREQELPAFGIEAPGGTTVLTVYSFHLGEG